MTKAELRKIDQTNGYDCFKLQLKEEQKKFVSDPIRSLAQAYIYKDQCTPFGIYHEDIMVGYILVIYDPDENTYNLWHLMIDAKEQGHGYGRQAVIQALEYIRTKPFGNSDIVFLTCSRENIAACHMYEKLGFTITGRNDDEEDEYMIRLEETR